MSMDDLPTDAPPSLVVRTFGDDLQAHAMRLEEGATALAQAAINLAKASNELERATHAAVEGLLEANRVARRIEEFIPRGRSAVADLESAQETTADAS
jgi:hypothetical protein